MFSLYRHVSLMLALLPGRHGDQITSTSNTYTNSLFNVPSNLKPFPLHLPFRHPKLSRLNLIAYFELFFRFPFETTGFKNITCSEVRLLAGAILHVSTVKYIKYVQPCKGQTHPLRSLPASNGKVLTRMSPISVSVLFFVKEMSPTRLALVSLFISALVGTVFRLFSKKTTVLWKARLL